MAIDDRIAEMLMVRGAVPNGMTPPDTRPDPITEATERLNTYYATKAKEIETLQKQQKAAADIYRTLRQAGYSSEMAHKAVLEKVGMPKMIGDDQTIEAKQKTANLEKTNLDIKLKKQKLNEAEGNVPVSRSPSFTTGTGSPISRIGSFFKKTQAEMNPETLRAVKTIKSLKGLRYLLKKRAEAKESGIDVDAVLEYFGKTEEDLIP